MKLSELLKHVPHVSVHCHIGDPDMIDVNRVVELHAIIPDANLLRWTDGKADHNAFSGILIAPVGFIGHRPNTLVECADPKASIIAAIEALYPDWGDESWAEDTINHSLIEDRVKGSPMEIGAYSTIGGHGFGFHACAPHLDDHRPATIDQRHLQRFPHIGGVSIGEGVEIGSNTCIDRGAIGDTVIGDHTKIDNLVHIAHNVRIGQRCQIVAGAVIGGSAVIGDDVFIGIGAHVRNKVRIGNGATIGQGANVVCDVPPGETWIGNPARKMERP